MSVERSDSDLHPTESPQSGLTEDTYQSMRLPSRRCFGIYCLLAIASMISLAMWWIASTPEMEEIGHTGFSISLLLIALVIAIECIRESNGFPKFFVEN